MDDEERAIRAEVSRRLDRPFDRVIEQLEELFDKPYDEIEIHISTASGKKGRSEADVICDLVAKAEIEPDMRTVVRRKVVRWIGKPWRERENPWEKYKHRVPPTEGPVEEWKPLRGDEDR